MWSLRSEVASRRQVARFRSLLDTVPRDWPSIISAAKLGGAPLLRAPFPSGGPLHAASAEGRAGYAALLLSLGADPEAEDVNAATPLLVAAANDVRGEVVRLLLAAGCDVDGYVGGGKSGKRRYRPTKSTPLAVAMEAGLGRVVAILLKAGADVGLRDRYGRTPVMLGMMHRLQRARVEAIEAESKQGPSWGGSTRKKDKTSFPRTYRGMRYLDEHGRPGVLEDRLFRWDGGLAHSGLIVKACSEGELGHAGNMLGHVTSSCSSSGHAVPKGPGARLKAWNLDVP